MLGGEASKEEPDPQVPNLVFQGPCLLGRFEGDSPFTQFPRNSMSTVCVDTSLIHHSGCMQYTIISEMFCAMCCLADFTEKS